MEPTDRFGLSWPRHLWGGVFHHRHVSNLARDRVSDGFSTLTAPSISSICISKGIYVCTPVHGPFTQLWFLTLVTGRAGGWFTVREAWRDGHLELPWLFDLLVKGQNRGTHHKEAGSALGPPTDHPQCQCTLSRKVLRIGEESFKSP